MNERDEELEDAELARCTAILDEIRAWETTARHLPAGREVNDVWGGVCSSIKRLAEKLWNERDERLRR